MGTTPGGERCTPLKAKDAVSGLLAVPDNINEVFRTLELRFGRPELVIGALIQRARYFSTIRNDDFDGIMAFTTSVQTLVDTMSLLNSVGHLYNPQLRQELVSKLPASLRLQWGKVMQSSTSGDISIALFSKWLLEIAEAAAHVYVPRTGTQVPDKAGRRPEVNYTITRDQLMPSRQANAMARNPVMAVEQASTTSASARSLVASLSVSCGRSVEKTASAMPA